MTLHSHAATVAATAGNKGNPFAKWHIDCPERPLLLSQQYPGSDVLLMFYALFPWNTPKDKIIKELTNYFIVFDFQFDETDGLLMSDGEGGEKTVGTNSLAITLYQEFAAGLISDANGRPFATFRRTLKIGFDEEGKLVDAIINDANATYPSPEDDEE